MSIYNETPSPAPTDNNGLLAKLVLQRCSEVAVSNEDVARYEEIWKGPTALLAGLVNKTSTDYNGLFPTFYVGKEHPVWSDAWAVTKINDIPVSPSGKWYIESLRLQQCDGGEHSLLTVGYASALKGDRGQVTGAQQIGRPQWSISYSTVTVSPYIYLHDKDTGRYHIENSITNETALNSKTNNNPDVWYNYRTKQIVNLTQGEKEVRQKIIAGKHVERLVPVVRCARRFNRQENYELSGFYQDRGSKIGQACKLPSDCPYNNYLPPFEAQPFFYCGPSITVDQKYVQHLSGGGDASFENVTLTEQWQGIGMDYDKDFYGDGEGGVPWIPGTK